MRALDFQLEQIIPAPAHPDPDAVVDDQLTAERGAAARAHVRERPARVDDALDEYLHPSAGRLAGGQACLDDPGVVHHEQIAGLEKAAELVEAAVLESTVAAVHHQKPALPPVLERILGDQLGRQLESEITGAHARRC